jgi:hypothetical protein
MNENNLTFTANCVRFKADGDELDEYELSSFYSIYFGEGDPGQDGHAWTFYRNYGDDYGVWVLRGREQHGIEDSIKECILSHSRLECVFNERATAETGIDTLTILYDINEELWRELASTARRVFGSSTYFKLID